MQVERITENRKIPKKGHGDCPNAIAARANDLINEPIGRKHTQETQLRWERMDANAIQEDRTRQTSE